jgi:1-deoxy-D-xylulose-5-phosphate synthase
MSATQVDNYSLLRQINSPADLKRLDYSQLPQLCREIRRYLTEILSRTPGHFGASMGAVEIAVAVHYVYDAPEDKIIWDVGHQAYAHKLLTGRREAFPTLRQWGGISGFLHPGESIYDAFISGHASNSISAALGYAAGSELDHKHNHVVAVIGDGALSGGLAFEGLNNVSERHNNVLVILNDNHISIDPATGGLSRYLVKFITSPEYNRLRDIGARGLSKINVLTDSRKRNLQRFNNSIKALMTDEGNFFEDFSMRYFGPIDGNDILTFVRVLEAIKEFEGPKLLHVKTVKGKGYKPAEDSSVIWHAPGTFDLNTGKLTHKDKCRGCPEKFQEVFGKTLVELADRDRRIVGITPAMISGSSMGYMLSKYPKRVFDVGIAEGHAVTFSAGLAMQGQIPFCNIYSTFLQRAVDEVIHDVAEQKAPVILCVDRAGLVGNDGVTHQGLYDIAYLRAVPGLTMMSPIDEWELRMMMYTAYKHHDEGPFVIRYPRGEGSNGSWQEPFTELPLGKADEIARGERIAIVSYGPVGAVAREVVEQVRKERGEQVGLVNLRFLKPLDTAMLDSIAERYDALLTVEDAALAGGMGSTIMEYYSDRGVVIPIRRLGVADEFIRQGDVGIQRSYTGIDAVSIHKAVLEMLQSGEKDKQA